MCLTSGSVLLPLLSFHHYLNDRNIRRLLWNLLLLWNKKGIWRMCSGRAALSAQPLVMFLRAAAHTKGGWGASCGKTNSLPNPTTGKVIHLLWAGATHLYNGDIPSCVSIAGRHSANANFCHYNWAGIYRMLCSCYYSNEIFPKGNWNLIIIMLPGTRNKQKITYINDFNFKLFCHFISFQ